MDSRRPCYEFMCGVWRVGHSVVARSSCDTSGLATCRTPPLDPVAAAFLCQELIVDARLRHLARDRFEELQELSVLVFYFYNPEESQLELGGAAWAAMEAHMRDLSTALGFSSHVGVTTWSQRNFGTLYMVTSPAYQALL